MILAYTLGAILVFALLSLSVSKRSHDVPSSLVALVMRVDKTKQLVYDKKDKVWRKKQTTVIK